MRVVGNLTVVGQVKDLKVDNLAADPATPATSQMWYNTTENAMKFYDGTAVRVISFGGSFSDFVNKDGTVAMTGDLTLSSNDQSASAVTAAVSKGHLDTQLGTKQDNITGAATTIVSADLNVDRALISDASGKVSASTVTAAQLGYLSGLTSDVQTQIGSKQDDLGYVPVNKAGDSVSGNITFGGTQTATGLREPTDNSDAATKNYVDQALTGLDFQADVLNTQTDNTLDPGATPATGDRYIITDPANLNANFGSITGVAAGDIVEYDGTNFKVVYDVSTEGSGALAWDRAAAQFVYYNTSWTGFGGLDSLVAGSGLAKTGNTLNVNMGAGIAQLPTDEVGLDLKTDGGLAIVDPTSGAASTATDAVLALKLDGSTLASTSTGVKVAASGVTATEIASSVAGNGLQGGNGTALSVQASDGISVGAGGISLDTAFGDARYAQLSGATFTGAVVLAADPTANLEPATKQYVDNAAASTTALETRLTQGYYVYDGSANVVTTHTVNHGMGNKYVDVTVVDASDEVILPQSISFTDTNNLNVVLSSAEGVRVIVNGLKAA